MTTDLESRLARCSETLDEAISRELRHRSEVGAVAPTRTGHRRVGVVLVAVAAIITAVLLVQRPTPSTRVATGGSSALPFFEPTFLPAGMSVMYQGESVFPAPSDSTTTFFRRPGTTMSDTTLQVRSQRGDAESAPVAVDASGALRGTVTVEGWVLDVMGRGVDGPDLQRIVDEIERVDERGRPDIPGFGVVATSAPSVSMHVLSYGEQGRGPSGAGYQNVQIAVATDPIEVEGRAMTPGATIEHTTVRGNDAVLASNANFDSAGRWFQLSWQDGDGTYSVDASGLEPADVSRIADGLVEAAETRWRTLTPTREPAPTIVPTGADWTPQYRSAERSESGAHTDVTVIQTVVYRPNEQPDLLPTWMMLRFGDANSTNASATSASGRIVAASSDIQVAFRPTFNADTELRFWSIEATTPATRVTGDFVGSSIAARDAADALLAALSQGNTAIDGWTVVADSLSTDLLVSSSNVRWTDGGRVVDVVASTNLLISPFGTLTSDSTAAQAARPITLFGRPGVVVELEDGSTYSVAQYGDAFVTVTIGAATIEQTQSILNGLKPVDANQWTKVFEAD